MKQEKKNDVAVLLEYAGSRRGLTFLGLALSAVSMLLSMAPYICIWLAARDLIEAAPEWTQAQNVSKYGWIAFAFAVSGIILYFAGLGVRDDVEEDENKRNKNDFVLWFTKSKFEDQALKWDSPWGVGYPGWHIECSCIGIKHLGEYMDIHCGGVDNIFPHHTNEIAQSESYLGHKWCPYWFHVNHLNDQTGKMSKSKGDFLTVSLLESKGYDPLAYRMFCLQSHYRKPLVFSYDNLDNVESAYEKLVKKIATFKDEGEMDQEAFEAFRKKFADAIRDDLNTSMALTIVYDVVKADISEKTKLALLNDFDQVLALNLTTAGQERLDAGTSVDAELEQFINEKIAERAGAKKAFQQLHNFIFTLRQ